MENTIVAFFAAITIGSLWVTDQAWRERLPLRFIMTPVSALYVLCLAIILYEMITTGTEHGS